MTALVLLPIVILTITHGMAWHFALLIAILTLGALLEFYRMALPDRTTELVPFAVFGAISVFIPLFDDHRLAGLFIASGFLLTAFHFLYRLKDMATVTRELALVVTSLIYIPFMLSHLVMISIMQGGRSLLLMIMLIVMSNDAVAYYVGSAFGRNRLYEAVSPKKSIEGAAGGLVGGLIGAIIAKLTFFPQLAYTDAAIAALLVGLTGQIGDLFESMLKRSFGVKDSGAIFPGHGGVLDRLDSIIFAAPVTYYLAIYLFGRL